MSTTRAPRRDVQATQKAPRPEIKRSPRFLVEFYRTAMGKKYAMALSGIVGLGFVVVHAIGNLHMYEGSAELFEYAEGLREIGEPLIPRTLFLWILRSSLILAIVVHVHAAYSLTALNRRKRPTGYQAPREYIAADYASRTMVYTGTIVLAFILFHLADLTWGVAFVNPDWALGAVTNNLVSSLSRVPVALFYMVAMLALGLHIFHGTWSLFQTLGLNSRRFNAWRRNLAIGVTVLVVGLNLTFPLANLLGVVECDAECERQVEEAQSE